MIERLRAWGFGRADICRDSAHQPARVSLGDEAGSAELDGEPGTRMVRSKSAPDISGMDMSSRISATAPWLRTNAKASVPLCTACASKPDALSSDTNERARGA